MDRQQLAVECGKTADDIFAFVAERGDARGIGPAEADSERVIAQPTRFHEDFSVIFADRLQHLIIRLSEAGFSTDQLDSLSYAGTDRLGARAAAETLKTVSDQLT